MRLSRTLPRVRELKPAKVEAICSEFSRTLPRVRELKQKYFNDRAYSDASHPSQGA